MEFDFCLCRRFLSLLGTCLVATVLTGCGGTASVPTAEVKGKVTMNGAPVKGGTIVIAPLMGSGQMASGEVQQDGTFVMTTTKANDGAPIGKSRVSYKPPKVEWAGTPDDWDSSKGDPPKPKTDYDGMVPKVGEIEVKEGSNDITVELVKG